MVCNKKRKPVFIKRKWNHVVFSRATILSFHPVLISCFGSWWHEERDTIFTMLTPSRLAAHLVVFKISIHLRQSRSENLTAAATVENSNLCLHGPISTSQLPLFKILRTISSGHDVIHTPVPFPVRGFIIFTNLSARAGYDTRSIFKQSLTGLNSEFSFS